MKRKEKRILKFIINQNLKHDNNGIYTKIGSSNISKLKNISQDDFLSILLKLEINGFFKLSFYSDKYDLSAPIDIYMTEKAINYFSNNKKRLINKLFLNIYDFIKFIVPTLISIISLIIAILSYIQ